MSEKIQGRLRFPSVPFYNLISSMRNFENWWDILLFRSGLIGSFELRAKDGRKVSISNKEEYVAAFQKFTKERHLIKKEITNNYKGELGWLDVKNKTVIDIGASVGRTSIYFAMEGAKRVIAVEVYPYTFKTLKENLKESNLPTEITAINVGIGAKDGSIRIPPDYKSVTADDLKDFSKGKVVKIMSISTLLKAYKVNDAVLKIDCEGGEYPAILNSSKETLRKFSQIHIEYHYGYGELERYLRKCGFDTKHTIPQYIHNKVAIDPNMYNGWLRAERR